MLFLDVLLCTTVPPSQPINIFIQSMDIGPTFAQICWQDPSFRGIPGVSRYVITVTPVDGGADPLTFSTNNGTRDFKNLHCTSHLQSLKYKKKTMHCHSCMHTSTLPSVT